VEQHTSGAECPRGERNAGHAFERRLGSVKVAAGLSDNNIISFVDVRVKFESRGVERFVSELLEQELLTWGITLSARR